MRSRPETKCGQSRRRYPRRRNGADLGRGAQERITPETARRAAIYNRLSLQGEPSCANPNPKPANLRHDATRCIHSGEDRHGQAGPLTTPIEQTSVFIVPSVEELRRYAKGNRGQYLYSRYGNPTVAAAEEKIAALEGAEAAIATSSGMAAEMIAVLAACQAGDEIVSMLDVYGGTVKLFEQVLPRCGIKDAVRSVPRHQERRALLHAARRACFFWRSPTNPTLRCVDLAALCELGRKRKACVVVDNTFATPILQKPLELGADIVIHSATKYLGGHSDLTAGVLAGSKKWMDAGAADDDPDRRMPRSGLRLSAVSRAEDAGSARGARLPQCRADCRNIAAASQGCARVLSRPAQTTRATR